MGSYVIDETEAARRELAVSQFAGHQNAEDLIRSHFASIPPEVRSGLRLGENPDALAAAKEANVGEKIEVPEGGRLIDWSVRGTDPRRMVVSYVWEDEAGRWHHGVQGYNSEYRVPEETPAQKTQREVAMADHKTKKAGAEFNADVEEKLAEYRRELEAELSDKFASLKDDLITSMQEIVGKDAKTTTTKKSSTTSSSSTPQGKKADETGESGKGNADEAPEPDGADDGSDDEGADDGEATWPRNHEGIDEIAKSSGVELPDDWDDLKTAPKIEYLESKGVKPEAQG